MIKIMVLLLASLPLLANAEVYQWQDQQGSTHFSDRVHPDAKILTLDETDSFYTVKTVYDGDTVVLDDNRKIRLLGINTPEVQHRGQVAQAGGEEAKKWLHDKLLGKKVRLELSEEQTDKYGRTLAHVFTEQDEHINLQLVAEGLAAVNIYPPNLLYVNELVAAENAAEQAKRGIWQSDDYAVLPVENLTEAGSAGWTRLQGKVTAVKTTAKSIYLQFSDLFSARIERKWAGLFPDPNSYRGRMLEVRGWLSRDDERFTLLIRHPSAIKIK